LTFVLVFPILKAWQHSQLALPGGYMNTGYKNTARYKQQQAQQPKAVARVFDASSLTLFFAAGSVLFSLILRALS